MAQILRFVDISIKTILIMGLMGWASLSLAASNKAKLSLQFFEQLKPRTTVPSTTDFVARGSNYYIKFLSGRIEFNLIQQDKTQHHFAMVLPKAINPEGKKPVASPLFRYRGSDTDVKHAKVTLFKEVLYSGIAPGIDIRFYFNAHMVEYDLVVSPGYKADEVRLLFSGVDSLTRDTHGRLALNWGKKSLYIKPPVSYVQGDSHHKLASHYLLKGNEIGFKLAQYEPTKTVVIDPVIDFLTYWGGYGDESAKILRLAPDGSGDYYIAGTSVTYENIDTLQHNYKYGDAIADSAFLISPLNNHAINKCIPDEIAYKAVDGIVYDYDAYIARFNSANELVFATYFGGCGNDSIKDMELRLNGTATELYTTGFTLSKDFPKLNAPQQRLSPEGDPQATDSDAFVSKFDQNGELLFSTYLGGDGKEGGRAITVDSLGRIYVLGYTHSRNWPDAGPCSSQGIDGVIQCKHSLVNEPIDEDNPFNTSSADAFIARIGATEIIDYVSYLGGALDDWGADIAIVNEGGEDELVLVGNTASKDFPIGTKASLRSYREKKDEDGNELICSRFIPVRQTDAHTCEDVFILKMSLDAKTIYAGTFFGGNEDDTVTNVSIDVDKGIVITGVTQNEGTKVSASGLIDIELEDFKKQLNAGQQVVDENQLIDYALARFPLVNEITDSIDDSIIDNRSVEVFVTKFASALNSLVYSSFLRGSDRDGVNDLVLKNGAVYLAGHTQSNDFPVSAGFNAVPVNGEAFIAKLKTDTDNQLSIAFSTLLGAEGNDYIDAIDVDSADNLRFIGGTRSTYFPLVNATDDTLKTRTVYVQDVGDRNGNQDREEYYADEVATTDLILGQINLAASSVDSDLQLTFNDDATGNIVTGTTVVLTAEVENTGTEDIKDVRIFLKIPFSAFEFGSLNSDYKCYRLYASPKTKTSNGSDYGSVFESYATSGDKSVGPLYCLMGDLVAGSENKKSVTLSFVAAVDGAIEVNAAATGQSYDKDQSNNRRSHTINVVEPVEQGSLSLLFVICLMVFVISIVGMRRRKFGFR